MPVNLMLLGSNLTMHRTIGLTDYYRIRLLD